MGNPNKTAPLKWSQSPIVDERGFPSRDFLQWLSKVVAPVQQVVTPAGELHVETPVRGRTEGIGTTVQHLDATGKLASTDAIAVDGAGSPLTGGKRAAVALDGNNRLTTSFHANAVNLACCPTSAFILSNDGVSTAIVIQANTFQFGPSTISYNSGTVDPGVFGTFYIYADDPNFAGGAVNYRFTTSPIVIVASDGRVNFGKIKTAGGSASTGGGNTGGTTPGGAGGRGVNLG